MNPAEQAFLQRLERSANGISFYEGDVALARAYACMYALREEKHTITPSITTQGKKRVVTFRLEKHA